MMLADRLRAALEAGRGRDTVMLRQDLPADQFPPRDRWMAAAVLVAVVDRPEPTILLTTRSANMNTHAGQVAFPGGRIDPGDADAIDAALREAEEEIGLSRRHVDVIGTADRYRTGTGFDVTPVIAVIPPDLPLAPHEAEVADVFEVPLLHALATANHVERSAEWQGRVRNFYEIAWGERRIWGATAGMIVNLARRLEYQP